MFYTILLFRIIVFQVEVKRAEKRDSKPSGMAGGMPGMGGYPQHSGGHPAYGAGAYPQQGATL